MLPRIVLVVLQLLAAWYIVPPIKTALPVILARPNDILVDAVLYALVIMIVGFTGSLILKGLRAPGAATLGLSLLLALVFAGLTLVPAITQPIHATIPALRTNLYLCPLVGALIGYFLKR